MFLKPINMKRKIIILIALPLIASGCLVSKKKYNAMTAQKESLAKRLSSEQTENKALKKELESATADFETMNYELHKSDALKSDKVSDLMAQSEAFQEKVSELERDLVSARRQFQNQKESSIESASALEALNKKIRALASDTASMRYTLHLTKERQQALQLELNTTKQQYREASAQATRLDGETAQQKQKLDLLEQQLVDKTQTLQNISDSFIELRKALLSARAAGNALDPNNNKMVDKIARLLGHY